MTPNEYQKEALRTASGMSKEYPRILNGLMGLNGEAGECIDILKKHLYQGHAFDSEHMAKELGDVAWYLAISAEAIGYAAGSEMAESAEGGLSGVLQTIADIVSGGFDMEPVIRPVLDLSAVSAGADALNNLFYSQRAVGLVGQAAVAFEAQRVGSSQTTISVDNDDVVAELRTLRGEMASMLERMEKLRVVLNTGALVGELAEPMDAALGQRSTQRGRGI